MTNISPADLTTGYCTNVHAGVDLPAIRDNLDQFAVPIRDKIGSNQPLGVGLWIPDAASRELAKGNGAAEFAEFLSDRNLLAYTINGFPYDNFHQDVVKHRVYLPTWWESERLEYTQRLAQTLAVLLPESAPVGSISTLPIGWPNNPHANESELDRSQQLNRAGQQLRELAIFLQKLESATGRQIVVAIEPEPGCILDTTDDVIDFFHQHLPDAMQRRYITVCHDVCHAAVMMEPQGEVISKLAQAGIGIGKVQVSSAIVADWQTMSDGRRVEAMNQLAGFAEDRYLHQTGRRTKDGNFVLAEDLPSIVRQYHGHDEADSAAHRVVDDERWVVHFHVPIFLERFGHLSTSHNDVNNCLRTLIGTDALSLKGTSVDFTGHLEVETYAWTVLPEAMQKRGLADDIAGELEWLRKAIVMCG